MQKLLQLFQMPIKQQEAFLEPGVGEMDSFVLLILICPSLTMVTPELLPQPRIMIQQLKRLMRMTE